MERTRHSNKILTSSEFHALASELVARANLAARLGEQYGGDRDLYQALGYKTKLVYTDFTSRYVRQDMAKAIIDRPVKATWQGELELIETEDDKETAFEKAWRQLDWKLQLKTRLSRVDRLTGIGRYGVLLLGLDDVGNREGFVRPVNGETRKLLYVKPFGEGSAKIDTFEDDPKSERYGMPLIYGVEVADANSGSSSSVKVHHSRVIHIVDDNLESEIIGTPRLEAVFNRLMDLEKLVGGDAEMFWRGARPGFQGMVDKDYQMTQTMKDDMKDQIDEYEHNLRRILINEGVDLKALDQQVADPKGHFDVQVACISAVTGIPQRILSGSERGELASTQDAGEWKTYVQARREDHAEPKIIRPFVDRLIELKILPSLQKDEYRVKWLDLFSVSEKERVDIGKARANAIREYTTNPLAESIMPPAAFFELCLGLSAGQIELVTEMVGAGISEEQKALMKEIDDIIPKPVPAGKPIPKKKPVNAQMQASHTDWKKVYEDGGAHWMDDLQPTQFAQEFAEELVEEGKTSLLEIGCGNGRDSILFSMAKLSVTGIDLVPEAVKLAKENAERVGATVDFQEGNAEELTFADGTFDAVYSLSVLHSTDMKKSIPEISRVLKSKGLALIYIYSNTQYIDGKKDETTTVDEFIGLLKDNDFNITNFYTLEDEEYDEAGEKHGIIVVKLKKNG